MPEITICHQPPGQADSGKWNTLVIDTSALGGHDDHDGDIWPPLPPFTEGRNWDAMGFEVYQNGCALVVQPSPIPSVPVPVPSTSAPPISTPSPVPSIPAALPSTLPVTGIDGVLLLLVVLMLVALGMYLRGRP